jgi:hypothetical protein
VGFVRVEGHHEIDILPEKKTGTSDCSVQKEGLIVEKRKESETSVKGQTENKI